MRNGELLAAPSARAAWPATSAPAIVAAVIGSRRFAGSLNRFFSHVQLDRPVAYIVCMAGQDDGDAEMFDRLTRAIGDKAVLASDGIVPESGRVYFVPFNRCAVVGGSRLHLWHISLEDHVRINHLLASLALAYRHRSVAALLAGAAGSAREGIEAINRASGLLLAEDPDEIGSQQLAVEHMPARIVSHSGDYETAMNGGTPKGSEREGLNTVAIPTRPATATPKDLEARLAALEASNAQLRISNQMLLDRAVRSERENDRLNDLLKNTRTAVALFDHHLDLKACTPAAAVLFDPDMSEQPSVDQFAARLHYSALRHDVGETIRTQQPIERLVRQEDGDRLLLIRILPHRIADEGIEGAALNILDIGEAFATARKSGPSHPTIMDQQPEVDEQLRRLMGELQHRVKNILAVVRSIFARTADASESLADCAAHFEGRLNTLARTHNVLIRTTDGGLDLEELIRDEMIAQGARDGEQFNLWGPPVRLRQKAAEMLGLAVHELATNAAKFGALAQPGGRVGVTWRLYGEASDRRLALRWRETGVRVIDLAPTRRGFGRELIEDALPYQLGAKTLIEFARGGASCVIDLPFNDRISVSN